MRTNYIIACWSGLRRVNPNAYIEERPIFLKRHVESLLSLKHSLDQITFVVNRNPAEPESYRRYLESIPRTIGGAQVVITERQNVGYSYGAYSDVFGQYRLEFDRYFLMEDDYLFREHEFDRTMHGWMDQEHKCGLLSFVVEEAAREWLIDRVNRETPGGKVIADSVSQFLPERFRWPRVMLGLVRAEALDAVFREFGRLPYSGSVNHTECKFEGQFALPAALQKVGWGVCDVIPRRRVTAFGPQGQRFEFGPPQAPEIVRAIQFLL